MVFFRTDAAAAFRTDAVAAFRTDAVAPGMVHESIECAQKLGCTREGKPTKCAAGAKIFNNVRRFVNMARIFFTRRPY